MRCPGGKPGAQRGYRLAEMLPGKERKSEAVDAQLRGFRLTGSEAVRTGSMPGRSKTPNPALVDWNDGNLH